MENPPPKKINLISCESLTHVSDIKLIRTDTTLDLSQKAEKGQLQEINQALAKQRTLARCAFSPEYDLPWATKSVLGSSTHNESRL
ncbi:hypothetical protein SLEP1_g21564 [Rubroshorea leprosula]|uniref:Uncharacterized protein n=1 Tax=Rubroshorea leprosula TaxID=152421 RepID=A0AAV5JF41_9ROSI|nr:hypothetical protein SLEP1_g21564 [Rubroshorea leprosula]